MPKIVEHTFKCCQCGLPVVTKWKDNEDGTTNGMLSGDDHCLVGDWVFHNTCWDKLVEENPP